MSLVVQPAQLIHDARRWHPCSNLATAVEPVTPRPAVSAVTAQAADAAHMGAKIQDQGARRQHTACCTELLNGRMLASSAQ